MAQLVSQLSVSDNQITATTETTTMIIIKNECVICNTENTDESSIHNESTTDVTANKFESKYSIESINADCLLHICQYLKFSDVVNLAQACTRLQDFARSNVFPSKARRITIETNQNANTVYFTAPLSNTFKLELTLESLKASLISFGEFVEDLTIERQWFRSKFGRIEAIILEHCENLTVLCLNNFKFTLDETHALCDRIEKLQSLKELDFNSCIGITNNWPSASKVISKLEKLSLYTNNKVTIDFLKKFRNLFSLTITFEDFAWRAEDLAMILELNGSSLEYLKIVDFYNDDEEIDYESIATVISEKLPKLKRLDFKGDISERSMIVTELPHLRSLSLDCTGRNINSIMQRISDNGIIEEFMIYNGLYYDRDTDATPFIFNQLRHFGFFGYANPFNFLRTLTTSHMPEIHTFEYENEKNPTQLLLTFFESKKTLKSISIYGVVKTPFLRQIIEILKKPCTPKRPFLHLKLHHLRYTAADMELLKVNRHLIKLEGISGNIFPDMQNTI